MIDSSSPAGWMALRWTLSSLRPEAGPAAVDPEVALFESNPMAAQQEAARRRALLDPPALVEGKDPFEPAQTTFTKGPKAGQPMDLEEKRSARLLRPAEAALYGAAPGETLVANVRHDGHWWVAKIPPEAVEEVIFQMEHFPMPGPVQAAGHSQIRFRLREGSEVTLIPQVPGEALEPRTLGDLLFSVEAVWEVGGKYDLVRGAQDHFAVAYRLVSLSDRASLNEARHHAIDQYRLELTDDQKQQMLVAAARMGAAYGLEHMYNTLTRSCTTEAFALIDDVLDYGVVREAARRALPAAVPVLSEMHLRQRGLTFERLPNLEHELNQAWVRGG